MSVDPIPPPPPRSNIARYCLAPSPVRPPQKTALIIDDGEGRFRSWTYGELDRMVRSVARGLRVLGLHEGARLMIRMDNDLGYILAFFGAMAAGLVPLPSSGALTDKEAAFLVADSDATALVVSTGLALSHPLPAGVVLLDGDDIDRLAAGEPLDDFANTAAEDPAFLIYTSGTVGRPKGVLHGHRSAWGRRPMYAGWYGITPSDVVLHAGAFNWTYTLGVGLVDPWANGATAVLYSGPADPTVWPRLIERHRVTIFATVPSLYRRILKYASIDRSRIASLRHGLTAGEALSPPLLEAWRDATRLELYEALGMSEISTYVSTGPGMAIRPGSSGLPQPGRRVVILAAGEAGARPLPPGEIGLLAVHRSDPGLMLGYWRRPEEEALVFRGDWFCGGDLAHMDEDGYVWYHGRNDDILNPMGYRLSPLEIERVLAKHPSVHDVAVGEVRVADNVRILAAFVVPEGVADEAALVAWAAEHLAAYKRPRKIVFLEQLPRTRSGKLLRRELPQRC
jgi:acyl-coenzyme A synthetase/AMP-(fatty) acid ligase